MSYILEALKKAQAERQLGSAPTIHAMPVHAAPAPSAVTRNTPLLIAAAAVLAVAVAAGLYFWRGPEAVAVVAQAAPPAPAPAPMPAPMPAPVVAAMPVPPAPAPMRTPAPPATPKVESKPEPKSTPKPVSKLEVVAAPQAPAPETAPEETIRTQRELPESVQRELPQIAIGGYIYSRNAADRLLLIDKVLRHEGEEVAPGLVLEKLLPKSAVMNFRGYRYRIAY